MMNSPKPSLSRSSVERRLVLAFLAILAVGAMTISILVVTPAPAIDDFFIGHRYAYNWAAGEGVVYNAGEPAVEGYTSFSWIALFTLAVKLGLEPLFLVQVVNVIAAVATLPVVFALGKACGRSDMESLFAPTLLALSTSFIAYPMLGMATSTFALVMAFAVLLMARGALDTRKGAVGLGVVLLALSMVRFDAVGLALGLLLYPVLVERRIRPVIPSFLVVLVGLGIYNAWRISYYGQPLPNTHYAKLSPLVEDTVVGWRYVASFFLYGGPFLAAIVLAPIAVWRGPKAARLAAWVVAGHLTYTIVVGGDWMPAYRFMLHVLPLYCLLMQEGLWRLRDLAAGKMLRASQATAAAVVLMGIAAWHNVETLASSEWVGPKRAPSSFWSNEDAFAIGNFLDEALPPDCLVATEWAGIIPSRMRQPILDILGLNDKEIISRDDFRGSNQGRLITPEYLASREPELVIVVARIFPTPEEAAKGIDNRPNSLIKDLYASLRDPGIDYQVGVVKIREEGYWPCLFRPGSELMERLCVDGAGGRTSRGDGAARAVAPQGIPG